MTQTSDFLIIGGGIIGMLTARELIAHGSVTLIERGQTGREASWAGGGILSPLYPWRYADPVSQLAHWGQQRYPVLAEELHQASGIDPEYLPSGLLVLDPGPDAVVQTWAKRFGTDIETLDGQALRECEPALNPELDSALWLPSIGQLRNPRLVKALRGAIDRAGVNTFEDTEVLGLTSNAGRINGIQTSRGHHQAGTVIVATGSWSSPLLQSVSTKLPALPVIPIKGQMVLTRAEPGLVKRITLYQGRYIIPRQDGRIVAGSTLEQTGYDKQTTNEARDQLRAAATHLIPALADYPIEHHWSGLRPSSPDGIPFIGPHPECSGLFVNTGHFRNGVVLGPASARLIADQILGRAPILDPTPYALDTPRPDGLLM